MSEVSLHWNGRYLSGSTPWDSGLPSQELRRVIAERATAPCRVLELGCGAGTNAVYLAEQGFDVTAVDCAPLALERGRELAASRGVAVNWIEANVCAFRSDRAPFDFVFDRGCYHCARRIDLDGFLKTLDAATATGSRYLVLTGNAHEQREPGPPTLHEHEIRNELGQLFEVAQIRAFHFQDAGEVQGPLGWSCLLTR